MNARDPSTDQFTPPSDSGARVATWYAQGHSDGLGDRLLMFDNTSAPSWEILRFKPALSRDARFERAVRERVDRLASFRHPTFPVVRPISELGQEEGVAVVSTYFTGVRLSEGLKKPRSAGFGLRLLRQLLPALAAFHHHAPGIAHGALTLDRIVLTNEGRLMIREHMVGSALDTLELSASRLWAEFGIQTPFRSTRSRESTIPTLDARGDVAQAALIVVSLMAGRRVGPDEYPDRTRELMDELEARNIRNEPEIFGMLRAWLERALHVRAPAFDSARDAYAALEGSSAGPPHREAHPRRMLIGAHLYEEAEAPSPPVVAANATPAAVRGRLSWWRNPRVVQWSTIALGIVAVVEAVFIGRMVRSANIAQAGSPPKAAVSSASPATSAVTRDQPRLTPPPVPMTTPVATKASVPTTPVVTASLKVNPDLRSMTATKTPPGGEPSIRSGGLRVMAPIEVHVLEGERVLGSSADGPIVTSAGPHELEFVNSAIGYRTRRVVNIKPGEIASLSVSVPNGTLNINATPWASVWIDGNAVGDTPLGNVSVVPGEHEIVFRHPQLGERREKAMVRPDAATRVAVAMR